MTKSTSANSTDESKTSSPRSGIQVIARAASILRTLENEGDGLSLGQIAKRVDLPRSTVQRIVNALMDENMLVSASLNARVKLGPTILRLASNTSFDFSTFVRPHLEALSQSTGETVDLSMQRENKMVFVDQIASNHRLSAVSAIGEDFLMHTCANGKAALSLMSDSEIAVLFAKGLAKDTNKTITDLTKLMTEIKVIRDSKVAIDNDEHTDGISAAGTAFKDPLGIIFSVSVPVPTVRFVRDKKHIIESLVAFRDRMMLVLNR
jgi:DNA-binding IclR family transcriptional regulator